MKVAAALLALAIPSAPVQAQRPCLTAPEEEALATVALPDILKQAGVACAGQLSAASPLRRAAFLARFNAEADRAWPAARAAMVKLSDPAAEALLGSAYARPLLSTLAAPLIVGRIAPRDCPTIDRLVTLLEPLPPRNVAGVVVTSLQYLRATKDPRVAALPLCPAGTR